MAANDSVFTLAPAGGELPPVSSSIRTEWREVAPRRPINGGAGGNFSGAPIDFQWDVSGNDWWVPRSSFLRIRCSLLGEGGAPVTIKDQIAPTMFASSALFQSMEHRINETTVSRIDAHPGLVHAMRSRADKSKALLDSVCKSSEFTEPELGSRIARVAWDAKKHSEGGYVVPSDEQDRLEIGFDALNTVEYAVPVAPANTGTLTFALGGAANNLVELITEQFAVGDYFKFANGPPMLITAVDALVVTVIPTGTQAAVVAANVAFSRLRSNTAIHLGNQAGSFEMIYRPPLGVWDLEEAIPCSSHRLVLQPQTAAQLGFAAMESLLPKAAADYTFTVEDIILEACVAKSDMPSDGDYLLDLREVQVQTAVNLAANSDQRNFQVPQSTYKMAVGFNDRRAGDQTDLSATKLVVGTPGQHLEKAMSRLQISYAGQVQPQNPSEPIIDPTNVALGNKSWATMEWYKGLVVNGGAQDCGGCETLEEFHARGAYYGFMFDKPRGQKYTDTQITTSFNQAYPGFAMANIRLCLFAYYAQNARLRIENGQVTAVHVEQK